ncbi:ABC transporter permease [Fimbriimonas ginsengisoli]|uniref:ABC-type transport system, permease component n=1 Tax=Fimbriimonas ginsengisoli Gsoil 348 TaxID=661478 RepID=A0A068NUM8_FIMGI|nr:ABC-2 family transporter protein [Fimbriimonas ginsengisoli]AIE87141.1 ABC-type transport system, permease component [Fimbriimonas ginsengisoli Gsoil 348]
MEVALRKWKAVFAIYFQEGLAYRASGIIWILTDVTTAVTMPLVWSHASKAGAIAGYRTSDFVLYYLCMLMLGSFVTSHIMWDLAVEIKEGQFSTALLRPMSFFQISYIRNLSWRIIRVSLFAPVFVLLLILYRSLLGDATLHFGPEFWLSLVLGHFVSFTVVMAMAMLALYTQEVYSIFELYYIPMLFLSGQLFPISLLPAWAAGLAKAFPFYFTTGAPTEILIGRVTGAAAWQTIGIQCIWIVIAYAAAKFLWRKGLRHYTGVGL